MAQLPQSDLEALDIYLCKICEEFVGNDEGALKSHMTRSHLTTRDDTNLEILSKLLFNTVEHTNRNHWDEGLAFLRTLNLSEPTFRQSLINKLQGRTEEAVLETALDLITATVTANKTARATRLRDTVDYDPTPIWLLLVLFEQLVLFPSPNYAKDDPNNNSLNQLIHHRLRLFRSGQIKQLYEESRTVVSKTPKDFADSPEKVQKHAQAAADVDNLKSTGARLGKELKVAPIEDGEDGNLNVLRNLTPPSLNLPEHTRNNNEVTTRSKVRNRPRTYISPKAIVRILRGMNKGKAAGLQSDSLDLFIKLGRHQKRAKKSNYSNKHKQLAQLFTDIANGNVPPQIGKILRTTYMVALQKDENDLSKLRPLGVPSALRRITAVLILSQYRGRFARYLLPYNYAVGVNGGIDVITNTIRLGVEKFIQQPEMKNMLPSRALVSLDIRNMFNAISRQKLREVMMTEFPELEAFADLLYEKEGRTAVKLVDGSWSYLPVQEGFSQGCPMSPVFAAIVLNEILTKIDSKMRALASARKTDKNGMDDNEGGITLIMAYVNDVNCLVPLDDVYILLDKFQKYGLKLGAVMNTEKTRIMTATNGESVRDKLLRSWMPGKQMLGQSLKKAIEEFSTELKNEVRTPYEECKGLRVLGVPIGSQKYCQDFIMGRMKKAIEASKSILEGLEDRQTMLQVFKACTVHKMTHLFAADVLNCDESKLPNNWHLWSSDMSDQFTIMIRDFLASLTDRTSIPDHSLLISNMSTNKGGVGLQHPRCTAIPSLILTLKRCIEYTNQGVWIGRTEDPVKLPRNVTILYENWQSSNHKCFRIFSKYIHSIVSVCVSDSVDNDMTHFLYRSSPNTCKDRIKDEASIRIMRFIKTELKHDLTNAKLGEILLPSTSKSLTEMSRLDPDNRMSNDHFQISLTRKLRMSLWPQAEKIICVCGQEMDEYGDHAFCCTKVVKGAMSDEIRDGLIRIFKRLLVTAKLIPGASSVEKELRNLLQLAPKLRPFDLSVKLDHVIGKDRWRTTLDRIGFDVTVISSAASSSAASQTAQQKDSNTRLCDGERKKYRRNGYTDKDTGVTLTGDEIIGEILSTNCALVPITVTEFGQLGSLACRFLYGTAAMTIPTFNDDEVNAKAAAELARSNKLPRGVLPRANAIWRRECPDEFYGYSYKAMDPTTWAEQQLGLVMSRAISNQIIRAHKQVKAQPLKAGSTPKLGSLLRDGAQYLATDRTVISIQNVGGTTEPDSVIPSHNSAVPLV